MDKESLLLFGERVRNSRNIKKFTQEFVAEKSDISLRFYQMIERGENNVSVDTLIKLSRTLNVSIDYLLFGDISNNDNRNPIISIIQQFNSKEKIYVEKFLQVYLESCLDKT